MNKIIKVFVVGGIGVVLACVAVSAYVAVTNPQAVQNAQTKQNIVPQQTQPPQPTAAAKTAVEPTAQPTEAPPAPPAPAANASGITVSGVFMPECAPYSIYKKKADKQLVGIRVTIKNDTGKQLSINPLYFRMVSTDGFVYKPELASCEDQIDTTNIAAGQAVRGIVGFEVEPGTKAASVQYTDGFSDPVIGPVTTE